MFYAKKLNALCEGIKCLTRKDLIRYFIIIFEKEYDVLSVTTQGLTGKLSRGRKDERTKGRKNDLAWRIVPVVPSSRRPPELYMSLPRTQIDSLSSC